MEEEFGNEGISNIEISPLATYLCNLVNRGFLGRSCLHERVSVNGLSLHIVCMSIRRCSFATEPSYPVE